MKLATRTYVKIALIVILCLGLCGFLGGCLPLAPLWGASAFPLTGGVVGCVGENVLDEMGDTLATRSHGSPAMTSEGSHFEVDAGEIDSLELDWLAGTVSVAVVRDDETGGTVQVDEVVQSGRVPVMTCDTGGRTLAISYLEDHGGLSGCSNVGQGVKNLTVRVPASLATRLKTFELMAASGRYTVEGIACERLELGIASGEVSVTDVGTQNASLSVASGQVFIEGAVEKRVELDLASGTTTLSLGAKAPERIEGSVASGNFELQLPANTALAVDIDKTSGSFTNQLGEPRSDASPCAFDLDLLSGNVTIVPAEVSSVSS